jgi:hypothetical protein
VAGATGYRIELFRGSNLIYATDTTKPEVSIPSEWRHAGSRESLSPGGYRWYVWPLRSGLRETRAVVQARLTVHSQ